MKARHLKGLGEARMVYRRRGNQLVRAVRCTSGPRRGRVVSNAAQCTKPIDIAKRQRLRQTRARLGRRMTARAGRTKRMNPTSRRLRTMQIREYGMQHPGQNAQLSRAVQQNTAAGAAKAATAATRNNPASAAAGNAAAIAAVKRDSRDREQDQEIKQLSDQLEKGDRVELDGEEAEVVSPSDDASQEPGKLVLRRADGSEVAIGADQLREAWRQLRCAADRAPNDIRLQRMLESLVPAPGTWDRFLEQPLERQLLMLENVSVPKPKTALTEGAVPNRNSVMSLNRLFSVPFPVGDLRKQIEAYTALPVPSMLRDFWALRANEGDDADARLMLREYVKRFLPTEQQSRVRARNLRESAKSTLLEYTDIEAARQEIIDRLKTLQVDDSDPDAAEENRKLLDRIYSLLNKSNILGRIGTVLPDVLKGEYPDDKIKDIAKQIMKAPISYKDRETFIDALSKNRVINTKLLTTPGQYSLRELAFDNDINMAVLTHLKSYGVGQQMKGPMEHALAILSTDVSIQGKGDIDVKGTGVEVKAAISPKRGAGGGRFGESGHLPTREAMLAVIARYDTLNTEIESILERKKGINIEEFVSILNRIDISSDDRKKVAVDVAKTIFGAQGGRLAEALAAPGADPNTVRQAYIKTNFDWYKNSDMGGEWEVLCAISLGDQTVATVRTGDDIDKINLYKNTPYIITSGKPQEMLFQFNPKG